MALREAQIAVAGFPSVAHAGFLHDAEKEYVEARLHRLARRRASALRPRRPGRRPGLVDAGAWPRRPASCAATCSTGCATATSSAGEQLLAVMDDVYDALVVVDFPDALTGGLRRTLDALRAVLERTRGDVTTTVLQVRLQRALEAR